MSTDETTETTPDPTILTADEVAVLNAARAISRAYSKRMRDAYIHLSGRRSGVSDYDLGRVCVEAEHADEALFSLLSASHIYLSYDLTAVQLHEPDHYRPDGRTIPGDLRLVPVA